MPRSQEPLSCSFTHRPCSQPRLEGQEFCIKHILEDKNAPFKQCSYISTKNGKRCPSAAPKPEKKDGYICIDSYVVCTFKVRGGCDMMWAWAELPEFLGAVLVKIGDMDISLENEKNLKTVENCKETSRWGT